MRFTRTAGTVLLAATVLMGACGGDSNDPATFDPAGICAAFDAAGASFQAIFGSEIGANFALVSDELGAMTSPTIVASAAALQSAVANHRAGAARDSLVVAARELLRSRTA